MRRNYASLDLTALSASAADEEPDADALAMDVSFGFDANCEAQAAAGIAHLCLDADEDPFAAGCFFPASGNVGFPMELLLVMTDANNGTPTHPTQPPLQLRPTTPTISVPIKKSGLPSIRPSTNEPVRRSFLPTSASPQDYASMSKLSMSSSSATMRVADCMASGPKPLVAIQRNVIQSV